MVIFTNTKKILGNLPSYLTLRLIILAASFSLVSGKLVYCSKLKVDLAKSHFSELEEIVLAGMESSFLIKFKVFFNFLKIFN